jgi:hypothetical protein
MVDVFETPTMGAFVWTPGDPRLDRRLRLYQQVTRRNNAEADAGRHLLAWVNDAGFCAAMASSSTWTFADPPARAWWAELWAERVERSVFAEQALAYGLSDRAELGSIAEAWRCWSRHRDAMFIVVHGEVLARAPRT